MSSKLEQAYELFDSYNRKDPNVFTWESDSYPQEYFLALQLHKWVLVLNPDASEALMLASRCQHIGRWEKPRESYPLNKPGYLAWRKDLSLYHAEKASEILKTVGYENETIERVSTIVQKQKIKLDPEVQTIENALCLVFLQYQYEAFHQKHEPEKMVQIIKKSLQKMDVNGHEHALQLPYSDSGLELIKQALRQL